MPDMDFKGRDLVIATMHGKETVIAPLLESMLGVRCRVCDDLDTDTLGTFSGEKERADDPLTTARKKCLMALEKSGADLAVASEGSFGPHPQLYFLPADDECVLLVDKLNNLEIIARKISTQTNFNGRAVQSERELIEFAEQAQFPSHALILRKSAKELTGLMKGIRNKKELICAFQDLIKEHGQAYVETDMRAMHNPTRMLVIREATVALIEKINHRCPNCQRPGLDITDVLRGLPCSLCSSPTRSVKSLVYTCQGCGFASEYLFPDGKQQEDPMYCDYCNP